MKTKQAIEVKAAIVVVLGLLMVTSSVLALAPTWVEAKKHSRPSSSSGGSGSGSSSGSSDSGSGGSDKGSDSGSSDNGNNKINDPKHPKKEDTKDISDIPQENGAVPIQGHGPEPTPSPIDKPVMTNPPLNTPWKQYFKSYEDYKKWYNNPHIEPPWLNNPPQKIVKPPTIHILPLVIIIKEIHTRIQHSNSG
ncbi:MAG: hypothetical protein WBQ25_14460 [Nitrososphaeraceae archaeon]